MSENILKKVFQPSVRGKIWRSFFLLSILVIITGLIDGGSYYNKGADWLYSKTGNSVKLPHVKEIPFRLGLDLQGGSHLIYQADMSAVAGADKVSSIEGVRDVIERRVNVFGVSEPVVQTNISGDDYKVVVELAGISDVKEAIKMIGETPLLEFKEEGAGDRVLTEEEKASMKEINTKAEQKATEVLGKLLSGGDFAALAKDYTQNDKTKETGGDLGWITAADNAYVVNIVKKLKQGEITKELVKGPTGYEIYKLEEKRNKANPFDENQTEKEVKASHLLICYDGLEGCTSGITKEQAYEKIKKVKDETTPQNFAEMAKKYSTDSTAAAGGDLGWFNKDAMVKPFADTVFEQKVGTVSYIVETKFGYHIIYKQDERTIEEYKVREIMTRTISEQDILGGQKNWKNTELTGKNLSKATVQFDPNDNSPIVSLEFDEDGGKMFAAITERNVGKPVAIYLDNYPISIPTVNEKITGGKAVISGKFNIQEAKLLAQRLNAGALPVPISLVSQKTVGASLGNSSLQASLKAGIVGLGLVALFMICYYRFPGLLAVASLLIYGILVLAVFKIWPVTLSLSGLAGFILSIGIAVDANVLIFERLREELRDKKPLSLAIKDSFERAWPSIRDGNVSTLITCFILIQFSTSVVKGFGITLSLGVMISMFSAIIITKVLMQLTEGEWLEKRLWLIGTKKS